MAKSKSRNPKISKLPLLSAAKRPASNPPSFDNDGQIAVSPGVATLLPYRPWLLTAMIALLVARPLVPSEGVAWQGDGAPFCLLWLLVGLFASLAAIRSGGWPRRWSAIDFGVLLFVALWAAAAWQGFANGNPRATINMVWEVVAYGMLFWLLRQLCQADYECRAVLASMLALAVALASLGLYQVTITMPQDRAAYASDPDGTLKEAGEWYPPNSPERKAFEQRINSTEPLATFALTNSLAGYLAPWFIVVIAIGLSLPSWLRLRWPAYAAMLLAMALCLLLTKSRSAYVATAVGLVLMVVGYLLSQARQLAPRAGWLIVPGVAIAGGLIVATATLGGVDKYVVTEAGKSLRYRWEYWQASWEMIKDHPWWGVGPGNFQDFYTRYKLPQASEEIRDPHNWVIEILATAGWPTAIVFTAIVFIALGKIVLANRSPSSHAVSDAFPTVPAIGKSAWFWLLGGTLGWLLAQVIGLLVGLPLGLDRLALGVVVFAACWWVMLPWIEHGRISPHVLAIAACVLLIHLLAAGGILFPAVAGSLWTLLAIGLSQSAPPPQSTKSIWAWVAAGAIAALCGLQYFTAYNPILRSQGELLAGQLTEDPALQQQFFERAAAADPRAAEPWQYLAEFHLHQWLADGGPRSLRQFREASEQFLKLRPFSASAIRTAANWWRQAAKRPASGNAQKRVVQLLQQAVGHYPNSAVLQAELAEALAATNQPREAATVAKRALELDQLTPHDDKKLSPTQRKLMRELSNVK